MQAIAASAGVHLREPAARVDYNGSFTALFDTYYTKVFAFVYSRVHDVDVTKDLVSEVFERAYARGHQVRDQAAYSSWLFIIARNTIAGHYRRRRQELVCREKVQYGLRVVDPPPQPEEFALRDERIGHLMEAVKTLPRRDQELISLKFDAELSHVDIARIMGMTPLNVRVSIFRALKRLRARMESS
jgi:RNA polymerase sigma-70 factor (ECF subfamily)